MVLKCWLIEMIHENLSNFIAKTMLVIENMALLEKNDSTSFIFKWLPTDKRFCFAIFFYFQEIYVYLYIFIGKKKLGGSKFM